MTEKRFIYTFKNGTMVIIDKKDNVLIRDKYRACDYLNRLNNENEQLKQEVKDLRINVLDSLHEADEIQCTCSPCVVEECVKRVVE